jgi:antitoxin ParD1/3/4
MEPGMPKSSQLTITVTQELEAFIRERVASGRFDTASDVVREGLKLLEVREHEREAVLDEIRREISIGLEDAKAGNVSDGEEFFAELEREGPPTT